MLRSVINKLAAIFIVSWAGMASNVFAQVDFKGLTPPSLKGVEDSYGVNLVGGVNLPGMTVGIGTKESGINLEPTSGFRGASNFDGAITQINIIQNGGLEPGGLGYGLPVGTYVHVSLGREIWEIFQLVGSSYVGLQGAKGSLSCSGNICTYIDKSGNQYSYDRSITGNYAVSSGDTQYPQRYNYPYYAALTSITKADGEIISFNYIANPYMSTIALGGPLIVKSAVSSSLGWMLKFQYSDYSSYDTVTYGHTLGDLLTETVKAINTSIEYCDKGAATCNALSNSWPTVSLKSTAETITVATDQSNIKNDQKYTGVITDAINRQTKLDQLMPGLQPSVTYDTLTSPSGVTKAYFIGRAYCAPYGAACVMNTPVAGKVQSLTMGSYSFGYQHYKNVSNFDHTTNGPEGELKSWTDTGKPLYFIDNLGRKTVYTYDAFYKNIDKVIDPDATPNTDNPTGGYSRYLYDSRGNITSITTYPKNSGTPLVTSAIYPEVGATTCSNPKTCNKPTSITDHAGVTTTYTYDPVHGGLTSETKPAVNGVQAQIRYGYTQLTPYVKNSSSAFVANAPVWRLTSISKCMTANLNACVGTTDEQRTVITYNNNNLLPDTKTIMRGDGSLAQTTTTGYDNYGNVRSVSGPLSFLGNSDTTYYFYDLSRQKVGEIGTDPDGPGSRIRQATRITYNGDGKVSSVEKGKVPGTTLSDLLNAMTVLEQQTTEYSTVTGLPVVSRRYVSGVLKNVTQTSYTNDLRVECVAQRLNPAIFSSLPASACTLGTPGPDGGDRITKTTYDIAGAVTKTTSGYGTTLQRDDRVNSYDPANGLLVSEADGLGNKTAYKYDDFKRPFKTVYPQPGNGTAESTTDYTQTNYKTGSSLVDSVRLRDGQIINFSEYDSLARVKTKSGAISESFVYNNFNQVVSHTYGSTGGVSATSAFNFNALGWLNYESRVAGGVGLGSVSYLYDSYGRRSRLTWPDGFYVTYDYTVNGYYPGEYLQSVKESSGSLLASFAYDDYARRTSMTRGNGVVTSYGYGNFSRLDTLGTDLSGTADDISESFGYTIAGQVKSRALNVTNSNYLYVPTATGTTSYTPNALNQISTVTTGSAVSMSYDGRGNLTTDNTTGSYFAYNADNLLLNATKTGVTTTLSYDAEKRLYSVVKSGTTTKFMYDGNKLIAETDGNNNILRRYVPGPGTDDPITWYEGSGSTDKRYYTTDRQGSIVGVTLQSGMSTSINAYDEYGIQKNSNIGRYQYTGQTWIPEVGLYYYKARFYNPALGRFMQADPIGYKDGMNWYAYVGNDPVNSLDPSGLANCVATQGNGCIDEPPPPCECENRPQLLPVLTKIITEAISGLGNILHSESNSGDSLPAVDDGASEPSTDQLPVVSGSKAGKDNEPRSDLPRDPSGNYLPHPDAEGAHTTLGTREGSDGQPYTQGATFDEGGAFTGRTDVTNHGRPSNHDSPHFHPAKGPNSVGKAEKIR